MAKFKNGNLVLTSSQSIQQGGVSVVDSSRAGRFSSLALDASLSVSINEFSIDGTLIGNSNTTIPTEKAIKTYVDSQVGGGIAPSTDNAMARYDGTSGIQGSGITIDDSDNMTGVTSLEVSGVSIDTSNNITGLASITMDGTTINEFSTDTTLSGNSDTKIPTERAIKTYVDTQVPSSTSRYEHTQSTDSTAWTVVHNLGYQYVNVEVMDSSDSAVIPNQIYFDSTEQLTITFLYGVSGHAAISSGGGQQGPEGPQGEPAIAGAYIHTQTSDSTAWTIVHNLGYQYVNVEIADSNDRAIIPDEIVFDSTSQLTIYFLTSESGHASVTSGGGEEGPPSLLDWTSVNYDYLAINKERLAVDTSDSTSGLTVTLPASPSFGNEIWIMDAKINFGTANCTIARNGNNIDGNAGDYILDSDKADVHLVYTDSSIGWRVIT